MDIGILYACVAYVCSISIFMVWTRVHAITDSSHLQKPFLRILTFFTLFTLIDGTWGLLFSTAILKTRLFLLIFSYAFHICAALSAFLWIGFISSFLTVSEQTRKAIDSFRWLILCIQIIVLAGNVMNHYAFDVTAEGVYTSTKRRHILFELQFCYYIITIGFASVVLTQTKDTAKKRLLTSTIFFTIIPLLFGLGQMLYPDAPFYSLGFMVVSMAVYITSVTREREKVVQRNKTENSKLNLIVNALASDYEAVYYVDLKTSRYQNIVTDSTYNNIIAPLLENSNDFFADVQHNVPGVAYPDDKQMLTDLLTKENLEKSFDCTKPISLLYRLIVNGTVQYLHMKCVFFEEGDGSKKIIIGISNIDEQMIEKQQTAEMINAIGEAYESIYQVNTFDDTFITFRRSEYLVNNYSDESLPYSQAIRAYINRDVHPDYREQLLQCTDLSFLKEALKDKPTHSFNYYDIHQGQSLYYEMRIVKPRKYEQDGKILLAFINRTEIILKKHREMFITSLSDDYDSVYFCNINNDAIENIRSSNTFRDSHQLNSIRKFSEFVSKAVEYVHPDDREIFLIKLSPDNIRYKLNQKKSFHISYRQLIGDTVQYYRLKVMRTENWAKESEFMLGTSNVDDLIRQQISLTEENTRKTSVLNALAESYESICYVDIDTMTYIPYFGSDDLKQWYKSNYYRTDFTAYINAKVAKEHQNLLINAVSDENIASYREKVQITDDAFLSIQFRTEIKGVQTYCEFSLIKIDESHFVAAIQNRDSVIRKEREQKRILAEAKGKAEAANKAKTSFLFNMSHDIRTPMNAIKGFIELSERNMNSTDKIAGYLAKAKTSSDHLLQLINDVLDMSRIESGKVNIDPVPTDIRAEMDKLITIVDVTAKEKGVSFSTDFSSVRNNFIYADALHVAQIMLNIISNAIKYTKPGGTVSCIIKQLEDTEEDKASYCITVKDTGVGMTKDFQNHIFEEFSRAKNSTQSGIEGTGLGMAIVKRLVDMMGGDIEIASELGKGTIVQVYLTFRKAEHDAEASCEMDDQETILTGKKLLLVEDNEMNREIARDILEYEGLIIEEAEDGAIAFEKVRDHKPDWYDFVLMDIQMPYMNGYQAARAIRSLNNDDYSQLPIIAMTANAFEDDIKDAISAGMNGHLSKPINVPQLIDCLKKNTRRN